MTDIKTIITDIERQFFETFGIEPKHNDGCEISDRYWANEENADKYITFDNYMNTFCPESDSGACFATCPFAYCKEEYPQITDRILLELICVWSMYEILPKFNSPDYLKYTVLSYLTRNYDGLSFYKDERAEKLKQQVQSLFKEG